MGDPGREPLPPAPTPAGGSEPEPANAGAAPFQSLAPERPRLLERALRRQPAANAFVELNNLFASARDLREIDEGDVERIGRSYGLDVRGTFGARCQQLYRDYLLWCLTDRRLSAEELATLAHLATLLRLDAGTTAGIHRSVTRSVYLRTVEEVLADGDVSAAEREFLARLGQHLDIPEGGAENMLEVRRRQIERRNPHRR